MDGTLDLGEHLERFVEEQVRSGRYADASEVVREGLALLERSLDEEPPHDPDAYDRWFRAKVEEAVRVADGPDAVWIPQEEIEADWARERAEIEAQIAVEDAEAARRRA